jgi:hypothetical protein
LTPQTRYQLLYNSVPWLEHSGKHFVYHQQEYLAHLRQQLGRQS